MKNNRVYISGPMTGIKDNNFSAFIKAEKELKNVGYDVFNPAHIIFGNSWTRKEMLAIDLHALSMCDYIYMLKGWENSPGAIVELEYAKSCGIIKLNYII